MRRCAFVLRSERYSLNKLAIEHGLYGDSTTGIVEEGSPKLIAPVSVTPEGESE